MAESWQENDPQELASLADDDGRRAFFDSRPELLTAGLVWRLAAQSGRDLRIDLPRAARLAATAGWLARRLEDLPATARARRAAANVAYFQRRYEAAVEEYEGALRLFDATGSELEAAITRSSGIGALSHLGRYEQALAFADSARSVFEREGDLLHLARLEVAVGHIRTRQDRFAEAIHHFEEARNLFDGGIGGPVDMASTLRNIAVCHQDLNDFRGALEGYLRARDHCREHGVALVGLEVEYNIAYLYYLRGEYSQAIHLFEEARRRCVEHDDPHHAALCDLDLSEIFLELNLIDDALHLAERAGNAFDELGMEYETGKALAYQALATARLGRHQPALDLLGRAGEIFAGQDNRVWGAMVALYEALTLFADGRLQEAAARAERAAAELRDSGSPARRVACEVLRSRLAVAHGELGVAGQRAASALELALATGRPLLEFQAHLALAQVAEVEGQAAAALDGYREAHLALERLQGRLLTDELKIAFSDDKRVVYEGLVAVTLATRPRRAGAEEALRYVETAKSRSLSDLLAMGSRRDRPEKPGDSSLSREIGELRREINWRYRQIDVEELRGGDRALRRLGQLRREVRARELALLRALRRLQATEPELATIPGAPAAALEDLRAALSPDSALIEYFVARGVLYRFALDHEGLDVRAITGVRRLRELHRQLQFQVGKFRVGGEYVERFGAVFHRQVLTLLTELREALLSDWRPAAGVRHLVVVPHDFLHQVPFQALYDGSSFLIDELSLSYAPSATVLQLCARRQSASDGHSLILGVPDERAPRILDEVRAVAGILPESHLLIGGEATRERLARHGDGCRFLHLATHGFYRRDNPMFSALQLGDARVSLLDLYQLRLGVDLAVLSGCGTGLGEVRGFDELVGLTRGLLFAGARSVVATLWDVHDDSTAEFMCGFYQRMMESPEPAAALRHAMLTLRDRHPHPYYWAPFLLTGSYRAL